MKVYKFTDMEAFLLGVLVELGGLFQEIEIDEDAVLLTDEDWENVNKETQDDVLGMVMDFKNGRITASELAEKIVLRCNVTAKAARDKVLEVLK